VQAAAATAASSMAAAGRWWWHRGLFVVLPVSAPGSVRRLQAAMLSPSSQRGAAPRGGAARGGEGFGTRGKASPRTLHPSHGSSFFSQVVGWSRAGYDVSLVSISSEGRANARARVRARYRDAGLAYPRAIAIYSCVLHDTSRSRKAPACACLQLQLHAISGEYRSKGAGKTPSLDQDDGSRFLRRLSRHCRDLPPGPAALIPQVVVRIAFRSASSSYTSGMPAVQRNAGATQ